MGGQGRQYDFRLISQLTGNLEFKLCNGLVTDLFPWSLLMLKAQVKQTGNLEFEISQSESHVVLNS